jgi:flagellar hook assembly protein FlgD
MTSLPMYNDISDANCTIVDTTLDGSEMSAGEVTLSPSPNPFNPVTTITYGLDKAGEVKISVYNIAGELVETLVDGYQSAGYHQIEFNGKNLASGIYFCGMEFEGKALMKKLMLVK